KSERGGGKWGFSVGLTTFDNRPVEGLKYQSATPEALARFNETHRIGSPDVVTVRVPDHPDLSGSFEVRPDGNVSLPLLKEVYVKGLTPMQLRDLFTKELDRYIKKADLVFTVTGLDNPLYQPPKAGPHYKWAEVKDDYIELLPTLTEADLRKITGIADLTVKSDLFFLGVGAAPAAARAIAKPDPADREVNNYLNWDAEAVAAVRFQRDGKPRDLLLIRPEYHDEYLELLKEADAGLPGSGPKDRILGTMMIQNPAYPSTPNRAGRRYVLAVEAFLGDYPLDEQDLLGVKERIAAK
ncbi:MAG: hypothetical protein FJ290_18160, partial [Planctomycetes bacterium]|nr:hypothetical protein [Planctomycetota bacterium]